MQRKIRRLATARVIWGGVCLIVPGAVARMVAADPTIGVKRGTRILGARQFVEGLATWRWPRPRVVTAFALIDVVHASTMLGASVFDRRSRRILAADGVVAIAWAVASGSLCAVPSSELSTTSTGMP